MKPLLVSACGFALMMAVTACNPAVESSSDKAAATASVPTEIASPAAVERVVYTLAPGERDASVLIDADVHNTSGEKIGTVADVWLATDATVPKLIVREGGVAGLGSQLYSVAYDSGSVSDPSMPGNDANLVVKLSETKLESLPKFTQESPNDHRLASEMIGTDAKIMGTKESARIDDLILAASGEPRYAVISTDIARTNKVVVDFSRVVFDPANADGPVSLDLDTQTLANAQAYKRE